MMNFKISKRLKRYFKGSILCMGLLIGGAFPTYASELTLIEYQVAKQKDLNVDMDYVSLKKAMEMKGLDPEKSIKKLEGRLQEPWGKMVKPYLDEAFSEDRINRFPEVSIEAIQLYQQNSLILAGPKNKPKKNWGFLYPTEEKKRFFIHNTEDCPPPLQDQEKPFWGPFINYKVVKKDFGSEKGQFHPCFHANSQALAQTVNELVNEPSRDARFKSVQVSVDGEEFVLHTYEDLIQLLFDRQYTLESFLRRIWVDIFDLKIKADGKDWAVRLPTWISYPEGEERVAFPNEHTDYGFLVHKGGQVFAQIAYYQSIPLGDNPGQVTYWHPNTSLDPKWSASHLEYAERHSRINEAAAWFEAAQSVIKAKQKWQRKAMLPFQSYGYVVCSDAVMLAYLKFRDLLGVPSSRPLKTGFPLLRSPLPALGMDAFFENELDLNLTQMMPSDLTLVPKGLMQERMRRSYSDQSHRFSVFPEYREELIEALSR